MYMYMENFKCTCTCTGTQERNFYNYIEASPKATNTLNQTDSEHISVNQTGTRKKHSVQGSATACQSAIEEYMPLLNSDCSYSNCPKIKAGISRSSNKRKPTLLSVLVLPWVWLVLAEVTSAASMFSVLDPTLEPQLRLVSA